MRIRGHVSADFLKQSSTPTIKVKVNGQQVTELSPDRTGLFILAAEVPDAPVYNVEILAGPLWKVADDERSFTVTISMLRLTPRD